MDEPSNEDKICSIVVEQDSDVTTDRYDQIDQSEATKLSIEQLEKNILTTESLPLAEFDNENMTPIIDQSEDEPLLSIPPMQNNHKSCLKYWLEIFVGLISFAFITMIIIVGIFFLKDSKTPSISTNGCNKQSETGRTLNIHFYYINVM